MWVTSELADRLERIDPSSNKVTATIPVARGASAVAVGAGSVWVGDELDDAVTRVDPRAMRIIDTIKLGLTPVDLGVANGVLWVAARRA